MDESSNVLLLAPLTPTGNRACLELLASTTDPSGANVAAVTYTPPPETWISDWETNVGDLPAELAFIHANTVETNEGPGGTEVPPNVSVARVDPNQPMDIIAPLSEQLTRWEGNGNQTLVSVQTLTVLLEYVDFDTAFRYLHILTHRVQAADAIGFYHMDPDIHDEETINTLKTLFDAVVEVSDDGQEWSVAETYGDRSATSDHAQSHDTDVSVPDSGEGVFSSVLNSVSNLFSGPNERAGQNADGDDGPPSAAGETAESSPSDDQSARDAGVEQFPEEAMLTDEDRIRELLTRYGGRMKQADVTEETDWSKSTVSRKLSKMEEKGLITRVQVGRGNLVFLSGYEPETAKPPFEQETTDR
ncbi:helix-turn-helix domain-containing protein [Halorussus gelatinilyticus]|uniref:Helix-turn-helix domain-containing protein n=1 Tax=Halorussus gelatinilyticus TaxID=2937524 RepID=A0A8U0II22_9EURY|nr:MarR family transcriptional regulator [Halorussus gelatinilyticus]UPV99728.1 helix-turn-helix domain-containing protein [Halorussus gelatinilyticus]